MLPVADLHRAGGFALCGNFGFLLDLLGQLLHGDLDVGKDRSECLHCLFLLRHLLLEYGNDIGTSLVWAEGVEEVVHVHKDDLEVVDLLLIQHGVLDENLEQLEEVEEPRAVQFL